MNTNDEDPMVNTPNCKEKDRILLQARQENDLSNIGSYEECPLHTYGLGREPIAKASLVNNSLRGEWPNGLNSFRQVTKLSSVE